MARRRQLIHPALCGYGCTIEQEWDDADPVAQPRTVKFHNRCARHRHLSDKEAEAAIVEESERFNQVAALLEAQEQPIDEVGARIADDDVLEIVLPSDIPAPTLPLKKVRFR